MGNSTATASLSGSDSVMMPAGVFFVYVVPGNIHSGLIHAGIFSSDGIAAAAILFLCAVPGNIHSGVSGNDSIMATGVFSARELLRVTRCEYFLYVHICLKA